MTLLPGVRWKNVLVYVKDVVRVVGRLHRGQPFVTGAVVCRRTVVIVVGHEVDITAIAARMGMDGVVVVLHPLDVGLVVGRVIPDPSNDRREILVPVPKGRLVGADTLRRTVYRMKM